MRRLLRRMGRTSPAELRDRAVEHARTLREAFGSLAGLDRWERRRLSSRLHTDAAALRDAGAALERSDWTGADTALRTYIRERPVRFVIGASSRPHVARMIRARFPSAPEQAAARANGVLQGRYDLLGYRDLSFRTAAAEIDWHFDPVHGRHAPRVFWARVPYLDPASGDHKIIWELNRHQYWLALGRAAWLTDDHAYAARVEQELTSWLRANPPLVGINWASMLELAFRSISWIWALNLFGDTKCQTGQPAVLDLLLGLDRQLDHVANHLSTYFSPNTHLLGEGLALYVGGRSLPELRSARRWEHVGRTILLRESRAQVHPDGGHAELSTHYHRYTLDFYMLALVVARRTADPLATAFAETTGKLAEFCRAMADDQGRLPTIGDDDGGTLFPMCGRAPFDVRDSLALAAALLDRPELAVSDPPEEVIWMLGGQSPPVVRRAPTREASTLFPDTGYAVLRAGSDHAIVDVGPHGFFNGGHAHADALSLVLSIGGRPLLIDPGTCTYTMDARRRDRFRSTAMHNTVLLDDRDQSVADGPFHWSTRAHAHLDLCRSDFPYVEGWHDGYLPLVHRRTVLRMPNGVWLVADHLLGNGRHEAHAHWHLSPEWMFERHDAHRADLAHTDGSRAALATTASEVRPYLGDAEGLGWCAPVYGRQEPAVTLRFSTAADVPFSVLTGIAYGAQAAHLALQAPNVTAAKADGWHASGASVSSGDSTTLVLMAIPPTDAAPGQARSPRSLTVASGQFTSDARAAILHCSPAGIPEALIAIDCGVVEWTGEGAFQLTTLSERDLHLDGDALRRLSHGASARPAG